jgi:hypothetical protein
MTPHQLKWLNLLRYGCLYIFITGLLPFLAVFTATQEPWRVFFDVLSWPLDNSPAGFTDAERQLSAILSGVLCGWSWLLYKMAHPEIFNERLRRLMVQSTWVWFILDSGGSILSGLPLNAVSNVIFALVLLVPLRKLK